MQGSQKGFTLIELVVVIVILGILAATALPKFINLQDDAAVAATQGVAGAVSSGFALNYGATIANPTRTGLAAVTGSSASASLASSVMAGGSMPTGYTAAGSVNCSAGAGATGTITISKTSSPTATAAATMICTG